MSASGSSAQANGSASQRRAHTDGSESRAYSPEQKAEVLRIKKCQPTAFYEILAIEKTASDGQIKKSYRKISLLTHPDKNGYPGADEAFKMVSRAFQILSDTDKKSKYDRFGGDPDSRSQSAGASASPFGNGFAGRGGGREQYFYEDEISPEELFNRFFGGGMGGGFGPFGKSGTHARSSIGVIRTNMPTGGMGGPGFVFNMGGGPGFRVHQFGGNVPRQRPANSGQAENAGGIAALYQLLPLLLLFILPLISSLFSSSSSGPSVRFDTAVPPRTMHRVTPRYKIDYFIDPREVEGWSSSQFYKLDNRAEVDYINHLQYGCENESERKRQAIDDARGFFFTNEEALRRARGMQMPSCERLDGLRRMR